MDQPARTCPECGSTSYVFRGRRNIKPDPAKGTQAAVEWEPGEEGRLVDLPTNGGHPVKRVQSPLEVHHGEETTHLHP